MSLSFGILYAMRFDNMLSMYRASPGSGLRYVVLCPLSHQLPLTSHSTGSAKDRNSHILERLGPHAPGYLLRLVRACLHRHDNVP
jgi:hypothetical protein